jgi:superfamily II DNA or RNA helicase
MKTKCVIAGWFQYPAHALSEQQKQQFRENLTYQSPFLNDDGTRKTIFMFKETEDTFDLPIEWVRKNFPSLYNMARDNRVTPGKLEYTKLPDPNHPAVKDPEGQKQFIDDLYRTVKLDNNVLAVAKTGSGKTVCSLYVAAMLGYRTLILVDRDQLKEQWIREIQDKLGIPSDKIGVIQQDKCEWEDKQIVVGLLQTNARRDYPDAVYNAFGTVIVDECDVLSTEFFNDVLPRFNAKYKIGLTATPNRKDGSDVVLLNHLGEISVRSNADVLPVKAHVFRYYKEGKLWGRDEKQHMLAISRDKAFNEIVAKQISECYKSGRDILVVAEKIDQLELLMKLSEELGVPSTDIGQYTAQVSKYDRTYNWKKIGRRQTTPEELEVAKTKKVVFATLGMVKRAIDVPRWDTVIQAAPLWQGAQLLGRVRRPCKGKKFPISICYRHMKSHYAEDRYHSRYKEYVDCEAKIINH